MKTKDEIIDGFYNVVHDCNPTEVLFASVEFLACVTSSFIDCVNDRNCEAADTELLGSVHQKISECVNGIIVCATAKKGGVEA